MEEFVKLKRQALEKFFSRMNPMQKKAVFKVKGPLLILAGAGSGKTTVLVNRIANMIHFGDAYNVKDPDGAATPENLAFLKDYIEGGSDDTGRLSSIVAHNKIKPWNILAITFTNKAAGELKERISNILGDEATGITAATFHSACVRILRREGGRIGFTSNFAIYDTDDSRRSVKAIMRDMDISDKMFPVKSVLSEISAAKDKMTDPTEFIKQAGGDYRLINIGKIYKRYQEDLKSSNAMDFDDIINHTVELFEKEPDVLDHYRNLYKYIMVDEYQDTNMVQFKLISLLSGKYNNLCVVGDDDQSIYRFRGATIENILNFENQFECDPETDVIKLEQNYRSTQNILTCANVLISNNKGRKGKNLWTDAGEGDKVTVYRAPTERDEASYIAETIQNDIDAGMGYGDHAVLYRVNAQSNSIEQAMIKAGIPYRIFGGVKFYERKEIKDVLAYLEVISNHADFFRLRRIINEPKRGIGEATVQTLEQIVSDLGEDAISVMGHADELVPIAKRSKALKEFAAMIEELTEQADVITLPELLDAVLEKSGYEAYLKTQGLEGQGRLENIAELKSTMAKFEEDDPEPTLEGFLEEVALYTDIDALDANSDYVMLMTMHSAKGLEFPVVFVPGMEDNMFPSVRSMESEAELEEERRLAYVAITRAKKKLYLINSSSRMLYGNTQCNRESMFIRELPKDNIERVANSSLERDLRVAQSIKLNRQKALYSSPKADGGFEKDFAPGERVMHKKFGEGTVLTATPMSSDTLLEIAFDTVGTKKLFATFARLKKI